MIRNCPDCKPHAFQDSTYGSKQRVMSQCQKGYRCSICEKEYIVGDSGKKGKK